MLDYKNIFKVANDIIKCKHCGRSIKEENVRQEESTGDEGCNECVRMCRECDSEVFINLICNKGCIKCFKCDRCGSPFVDKDGEIDEGSCLTFKDAYDDSVVRLHQNCFENAFTICNECNGVCSQDDAEYFDDIADYLCNRCAKNHKGSLCQICDSTRADEKFEFDNGEDSGTIRLCEDCQDIGLQFVELTSKSDFHDVVYVFDTLFTIISFSNIDDKYDILTELCTEIRPDADLMVQIDKYIWRECIIQDKSYDLIGQLLSWKPSLLEFWMFAQDETSQDEIANVFKIIHRYFADQYRSHMSDELLIDKLNEETEELLHSRKLAYLYRQFIKVARMYGFN